MKNSYKNYLTERFIDVLVEVFKSVVILAIVLGMLGFAIFRATGVNILGR